MTLDSTPYSRSYEYDENGNLDRYTDRDGRVTVYVYDALNRMTDEQWLDGSENIVRDLHFDYDNADLLTGAKDYHDPNNQSPSLSVDYGFTYDDNHDLESTTWLAGLTPEIVLTNGNESGNRKSLAATIDCVNDFVNTYSYDGRQRMTEIVQKG